MTNNTSSVTVSGNQIDIEITHGPAHNWQARAERLGRDAANTAGLDWKDCAVFVKLPERGRCFTKQPGFVSLGAHG